MKHLLRSLLLICLMIFCRYPLKGIDKYLIDNNNNDSIGIDEGLYPYDSIPPSELFHYKIYYIGDSPDIVVEGYYRIENEKHQMGFANENGTVAILPTFNFVRPFSEGLSAFNEGGKKIKKNKTEYIKGGKWGYINTKGVVVIPPIYDYVTDCYLDEIRCTLDGREIIIRNLNNEYLEEEQHHSKEESNSY